MRVPQGLDAAAAKMGIPVITSDFFGRKDMLPGLGPATQFMDAVFTAVGEISAGRCTGYAGNRGVSVAGGETGSDAYV